MEQKEKHLHLVVGDLNTRLHAQLPNETDVLGKHIFGRGKQFVKNLPQHDKDQRMYPTMQSGNVYNGPEAVNSYPHAYSPFGLKDLGCLLRK